MLVRGPWVTRTLGVVGTCVGVGAGTLGVGPAVGRGVGRGVAGGAVGVGAAADGRGVPDGVGFGVVANVGVGALDPHGADGLAVHGTDGEAPGLPVGTDDVPGVGVGEGASGPATLPMATPASANATSQAT